MRRKYSLINRLILFLLTALPVFLVTVMPSLLMPLSLLQITAVKFFEALHSPNWYMALYVLLLVTFSVFLNVCFSIHTVSIIILTVSIFRCTEIIRPNAFFPWLSYGLKPVGRILTPSAPETRAFSFSWYSIYWSKSFSLV